eukprot:GHVT01016983.1.p2 GENE.GHVT01016983.1~~GHVT01016983.1.p2  ORF type:complete len:223 (-),score=43.75 GHVT01016983.1:2166-2834(-)
METSADTPQNESAPHPQELIPLLQQPKPNAKTTLHIHNFRRAGLSLQPPAEPRAEHTSLKQRKTRTKLTAAASAIAATSVYTIAAATFTATAAIASAATSAPTIAATAATAIAATAVATGLTATGLHIRSSPLAWKVLPKWIVGGPLQQGGPVPIWSVSRTFPTCRPGLAPKGVKVFPRQLEIISNEEFGEHEWADYPGLQHVDEGEQPLGFGQPAIRVVYF